MPSHTHGYNGVNSTATVKPSFGAYPLKINQDTAANWWGPGPTQGIASAGGGQSHNNLPPYYTVYFWKRVE